MCIDYKLLWQHPALLILAVFFSGVTVFVGLVALSSLVRYGYLPGLDFFVVPITFILLCGLSCKLKRNDGFGWEYRVEWFGLKIAERQFERVEVIPAGKKYQKVLGVHGCEVVPTWMLLKSDDVQHVYGPLLFNE